MDNTNQVKLLNPLSLAYMGDAVLDQFVRKHIILKLRAKPNRLHQQAKRYVSAKSQAATLDQLNDEDWFTEEEQEIVRRGRNAKSHTKAKNTDVQTYRKSSGLEAVLGFLYLENREDRLQALLEAIVAAVEERE
ncbi:Mini-ribonuclease 3 [Staphylococcus carnosus]|uniref:Mini-ribonuclease 3 n=3 Tax=Staphylococcus carnosus TaxID=1281 RepID=B9DKW4_STACT|nr:Mini-ribonuclease 3 [Staphylococcus carnosus]ANZ34161.1 ribonuclease III [Staphylococcus carnosus]KKB24336.1 ribonuclease III [Staphylococcus carnosus]UTB79146.1 ribonuclease III [Staphylococcus carnosus]UTB81528.1 ribonuclease III [Staphylococcus carnosus]UTB81957.1 ribonuclease III [Staphylococcus carnosus]